MIKKLTLSLGILLVMGGIASANTDKHQAFAQKLAAEAIEVVMADVETSKKIDNFTKLFKEACDLNAVGKFVVGRYWKNASMEQQQRFLDTFADAIIMSWASKFNTFKGGTLTADNATKDDKSGDVFVNSTFKFNDGSPDAKVMWRLRDTDAGIKIFDIIIEGISMAMSYRNEYASVLQQNNGNLDALIDSLKQKTAAMRKSFN